MACKHGFASRLVLFIRLASAFGVWVTATVMNRMAWAQPLCIYKTETEILNSRSKVEWPNWAKAEQSKCFVAFLGIAYL
jgi:hypothetical protein